MGWLRDLMTTSEPTIGSFGQLAEAALESTSWPEDSRIKPRSLSTLFSKLDRGQDLDWLRDRPLCQRALAELMTRPWGDVQAHLGEPPLRGDGRLVRLRDVRFAREIDLTREDLPPGLPPDVLHPPSWKPTWWHAPNGSGRSLAGAWLQARGLARHVLIESRDDWKNVPPRGALFVELGAGVPATADDWARLRWGERPVCVASSLDSKHASLLEAGFRTEEFLTIVSPQVSIILPELVDWVSSRLNGEGHFDAERAEHWMRRVALPLGAARTWGDALGLLGLLDEMTPRSLHGKSLDEVVESFIERRLKQAHDETAGAPTVAQHAFVELCELAARCLVAGDEDLRQARSLDAWTSLFHAEIADEAPDPSWFGAALGGAGGLSRKELRKLARKLPPAAYQLTRALERARLLRPATRTEPESFVLGPHFLVSALEARATHQALGLSPRDWGQALLNGSSGERMLDALLASAEREHFGPFHVLLDGFEDDAPELVAALEASVIALGWAELGGGRVPDELTRDVVRESLRVIVPFVDSVEPRFVPNAEKASLYHHDSWQVAWLTLTEHSSFVPAPFLPTRGSPALRRGVLESALRTLSQATIRHRPALIALLDRLFRDENPMSLAYDRLSNLDLEIPVSESDSLVVAIDALEPWGGFAALFVVADERKVEHRTVWSNLWRLAQERVEPWSGQEEKQRVEFWRNATGGQLEARVRAGSSVAWQWLLPHQFVAWLACRKEPIPEASAAHLPLESAIGVFVEHGPTAFDWRALSVLLERAPQRFTGALSRALDAQDSLSLQLLLFAARDLASSAFVAVLPPAAVLLHKSPERLEAVRRFLLRTTQAHGPAMLMASELLGAIESQLLPLRLAARS